WTSSYPPSLRLPTQNSEEATFFYCIEHFLKKSERNIGVIKGLIARAAKGLDTALFAICPPLRAWGCFSYITLTK
ncbi:MAG: hypothetical protein GY778_15550, partial [bacterium]|nr:hypothetical protein [bacterium]